MDFSEPLFDIKSLDDAGAIEGIAAGYGNVDYGGDRILPGAFTKTLAARDNRPIPMLHSHDLSRPIGSWREWQETPDGLLVKGRMTLGTRDADEAHMLARDGALSGISIGYKPVNPTFVSGVRNLATLDLHEASLVSVAMNARGRVTSIKSITTVGDIEDLLRDSGWSGRKAKAGASAAWKAINETETTDDAQRELAALLSASSARVAAL